MGESQVPFPYDEVSKTALKESLSDARMSTYITRAGGNTERAFALYLYNARLAKSLLFPLSAVEVTLRNAVDKTLVKRYGNDWHKPGKFRDTILSEGGQLALDKAFERAPNPGRGQIIATLTFDFWSNIFREEYNAVWRSGIGIAFPNIPASHNRNDIQRRVKKVNKLRNRVAHHEPILGENISDILSLLYEIIGYCSPEVLAWVKHHTTVNSVLRTYPNTTGATDSAMRVADKKFHVVSPETRLADIPKESGRYNLPLVVFSNSSVVGAITPAMLVEFMLQTASTQFGMLDLNDHCVSDVLEAPSVKNTCAIAGTEIGMSEAIERLTEEKIASLVFTSPSGDPEAIIMRAHRRY